MSKKKKKNKNNRDESSITDSFDESSLQLLFTPVFSELLFIFNDIPYAMSCFGFTVNQIQTTSRK